MPISTFNVKNGKHSGNPSLSFLWSKKFATIQLTDLAPHLNTHV